MHVNGGELTIIDNSYFYDNRVNDIRSWLVIPQSTDHACHVTVVEGTPGLHIRDNQEHGLQQCLEPDPNLNDMLWTHDQINILNS